MTKATVIISGKGGRDQMLAQQHQELSEKIWAVANKLRGPYRPSQCRRVMLPMIVLRRLAYRRPAGARLTKDRPQQSPGDRHATRLVRGARRRTVLWDRSRSIGVDGSLSPDSCFARQMLLTAESGHEQTFSRSASQARIPAARG
jgi:hypothetical protein